jgi:hypothetical protein
VRAFALVALADSESVDLFCVRRMRAARSRTSSAIEPEWQGIPRVEEIELSPERTSRN